MRYYISTSLYLIAVAALAVMLVTPSLATANDQPSQPQSPQTHQCVAQAKKIALACKLYATDHQGHYPTDLQLLIPQYLPDKKALSCSVAGGGTFACLGGTDTEAPDKLLLRSTFLTDDGKRIVVHSDTSVDLVAP